MVSLYNKSMIIDLNSKDYLMRVQLALNVDDLHESIGFYTKMFGTPPTKIKEGYANFAIENPPLKLVLMENAGAGGSLNHLGVEVETAEQVAEAEARIAQTGLETSGIDDTLCCFAEKTETWITGPQTRWEWYVKNADSDMGSTIKDDRRVFDGVSIGSTPDEGSCCEC